MATDLVEAVPLSVVPDCRMLSSELKPTTRKLVNEFVSMNCLPRDREVKQDRLDGILEKLVTGQFHGSEFASALVLEDNTVYRVNGKHTSLVLNSLTDEDLEKYAPKTWVKRFECDTMVDAVRLYATFDSRESAKSPAEMSVAFTGAIPELRDIPKQLVAAIVGGMSWGLKGERDSQRGGLQRSQDRMVQNIEFCEWAHQLLTEVGQKNAAKIRRAPVIAAMFRTWDKCQRDANIFWRLVRDESGPDARSPDRVLARFLLEKTQFYGAGARSNRGVKPRQFLVSCIHAWNAYRRGEMTSLRYYEDKPIPKVV